MVYSIIHSVSSLVWVFVILFFCMYITSIYIMHAVMTHFNELGKSGIAESEADPERLDFLANNFGTVFSSLTSLFMSICGGMDWSDIYFPFSEIDSTCSMVFLLYIFFVVLEYLMS